MKKHLHQLWGTRMTRNEFLLYLGMVVLSITGISAFFNNISRVTPSKHPKAVTKSSFGSGAYGV